MFPIFYLSKKALNYHYDQKDIVIPCQAIDKYKKNLQEIKQRKAWKNSGAGAQFMGAFPQQEDNEAMIFATDVLIASSERIIYSACLQDGTAIYSKSLTDFNEPESLVLRKNDYLTFDMDIDRVNQRLVLSGGELGSYVQHLSILAIDDNRIQYITEGECVDAHPCFDPQNSDLIYYDSCGFGADDRGSMRLGPKEICRLNLKTGDLESILASPEFDYFKPQIDPQGNLYVLRRPYQYRKASTWSLKDIALIPVKIFKAVFSWLDFFTQRYTGESLKTSSGANPAKAQQKSEEDIFIEGNLIKAQQTTAQNAKSGEKFPGLIPNNWQLLKISADGTQTVLKKSVMSYVIKDDHIIYSNGRFVVQMNPDQSEVKLVEGHLIDKIVC